MKKKKTISVGLKFTCDVTVACKTKAVTRREGNVVKKITEQRRKMTDSRSSLHAPHDAGGSSRNVPASSCFSGVSVWECAGCLECPKIPRAERCPIGFGERVRFCCPSKEAILSVKG